LINNFVLLLGDEKNNGAIESLCAEMAGNHKPRGVTMEQFTEFRKSFLQYVEEHSTYGDNIATAWNAAWDGWFTVFGKYY
jgi:hemoglobin-like flavoprotein